MSNEEENGGEEFTPDLNRRYAARVLTRVDQSQTYVGEQVASTSRWLTASLLAINGAGALATTNVMKDVDCAAWPGAVFLLGIVSALLSGTALQEAYNRMPEPLFENDEYWTEVSLIGVRSEERERELEAGSRRASRFDALPPLIGWISGLLFVVGAVWLAMCVGQDQQANRSECQLLRDDITSAKPKRANGVELYSALGCSQ